MDELTDIQKNLIIDMSKSEAFQLLQKLVDEIHKETKDQIQAQAENYSAVKSHWYTIFEILWSFNSWLKVYENIVNDIVNQDKVEEAVEDVNKSEEVA